MLILQMPEILPSSCSAWCGCYERLLTWQMFVPQHSVVQGDFLLVALYFSSLMN